MASSHATAEPPGTNVLVGPLQSIDLSEADRIFRVAFGTFLGLPNPVEFAGDADYVRTDGRQIRPPLSERTLAKTLLGPTSRLGGGASHSLGH